MDFESTAIIVGILGTLAAVFIGLFQAWLALIQRKRELRWNKAKMAKEVLDEIRSNKKIATALAMTEPRARRHEGLEEKLTPSTVSDALCAGMETKNDTLVFIHDCFHELFSTLDWLEHLVDTGLAEFEDFALFGSAAARQLARMKGACRTYAITAGHDAATRFLERFPGWSEESAAIVGRVASGKRLESLSERPQELSHGER